MTKQKIIYVSGKRYHTAEYPYRIVVEDRGNELIICHEGIINNKWTATHSIGITRKDLTKIIEEIS